ncbi:MAG: hypothetical protein AAF713_02840 [Pseudomonadota bacterium]
MRAIVPSLVLMSVAGAASADGVDDFCGANGVPKPVCACATERLVPDIGQDDYALYHRVGGIAAELRGLDVDADAAWIAALRKEAARSGADPDYVRIRAENVARAHRALIALCE